jgi:hypothetical protein
MTSPFDFLTLIRYRSAVGIFHPSFAVQKLCDFRLACERPLEKVGEKTGKSFFAVETPQTHLLL